MSKPNLVTRLRPAIATAMRQSVSEVLTALAFVGGWLLVTAGIASAIGAFAPQFVQAVWLLSLGLFAISLGGWRMLCRLIADGLYMLTKGT